MSDIDDYLDIPYVDQRTQRTSGNTTLREQVGKKFLRELIQELKQEGMRRDKQEKKGGK